MEVPLRESWLDELPALPTSQRLPSVRTECSGRAELGELQHQLKHQQLYHQLFCMALRLLRLAKNVRSQQRLRYLLAGQAGGHF
mmetsp:Transcript_46909/g.82698  ORF Transcript_46909/g.82698 Transcript_46909/m.82698 type:complete len:84 (-) Transcript_46909:11-262(-)